MHISKAVQDRALTVKNNMPPLTIPTIDFAPFFTDDESGQKKVKDAIADACTEFGFFQIVNSGLPLDLVDQAMKVSKTFFSYPEEVKREFTCGQEVPLPAGYFKQPKNSFDRNEYVVTYPPGSPFNVVPTTPPDFKETLEEVFKKFVKIGQILEEILNECLGLPPNFLKEFNSDRSWDVMFTMCYPPAVERITETNGAIPHEDASILTIVLQDDCGGLEVCKEGEWIPIIPTKGTLVVNIGDTMQVMSNKKYKSATHRVFCPKGRSRYSFVFHYALVGDKWVEPLPKFTSEIGVKPKYKGFYYKDYQKLRIRNETHPTARFEDIVRITHYEI